MKIKDDPDKMTFLDEELGRLRRELMGAQVEKGIQFDIEHGMEIVGVGLHKKRDLSGKRVVTITYYVDLDERRG